ncbi:hypothetical protein OS493_009015 [Desmophyllum pertusum]|uniref:Uncharacterized protein n=1 Tax=Desmophyllum pertusum TaxID=174260 RepID=A0A9X0CZW1_9CNID|nr:hypothetical protein OS493_009015 [Desmophyllum pertusum]
MFHSEPKPKKLKTTPIERKATPSSSWQEDPRAITDLSAGQQSSIPEYHRHWHQIKIIQNLDQIFTDQSTVFKLNVSFGFILRNNETGELQYYYASPNNEQVFEEPFQITTSADLPQVREALQNLDVLEWVRQRHPNSKWIVDVVTNITFFITKNQGSSHRPRQTSTSLHCGKPWNHTLGL